MDWKAELGGVLDELPFLGLLLIIYFGYPHDIAEYKNAYESCIETVYGPYMKRGPFQGNSFNTNFTAIDPSNVSAYRFNFTQPGPLPDSHDTQPTS